MSQKQPNNPLHGITLKQIVEELVARKGWEYLGDRVNIRCFQNEPSVKSSLKFLRKTPWARTKVEQIYLRERAKWERSKGTRDT
jgi:uncharacterized protein (DUF2132 family)